MPQYSDQNDSPVIWRYQASYPAASRASAPSAAMPPTTGRHRDPGVFGGLIRAHVAAPAIVKVTNAPLMNNAAPSPATMLATPHQFRRTRSTPRIVTIRQMS